MSLTKLSPLKAPIIFLPITLEPNTGFRQTHSDNIPDPDVIYQMQDLVASTLETAGFEHYEVSGYAKPGKRCRHNLNYWQFGDYLACGAGAHSKVTLEDGTIIREARFMQTGKLHKARHERQCSGT